MAKKDAYIKTGSKLRRIRSGLCVSCGHPRGEDGTETLCGSCRDRAYKKARERTANRPPGNCAWCGKEIEPDVRGVFCLEHRNKNRENSRRRIAEYRQAGLCESCGKNQSITTGKSRHCEECWLKACALRFLGDRHQWSALKQLYDSQGGKCAYSGLSITLGINASLDHILPISRFPTMTPDISQFKWVHYEANSMKGDLTLEEWTEFMRTILKHMDGQHG